MDRHISRKQAEAELERIATESQVKELLGEGRGKNEFLEAYRAFRAQLKDGDELRIELGFGAGGAESHRDFDSFYGINLVLYPKEGESIMIKHFAKNCAAGWGPALYKE